MCVWRGGELNDWNELGNWLRGHGNLQSKRKDGRELEESPHEILTSSYNRGPIMTKLCL